LVNVNSKNARHAVDLDVFTVKFEPNTANALSRRRDRINANDLRSGPCQLFGGIETRLQQFQGFVLRWTMLLLWVRPRVGCRGCCSCDLSANCQSWLMPGISFGGMSLIAIHIVELCETTSPRR